MPENFFNWIAFIGVVATCIATGISIYQAHKSYKASQNSKNSALDAEKHAKNIKQELKNVINRRELDRDAQRLKEIRSILSEKYTRNYNNRGSKLNTHLSQLNHLLNEISSQVIFHPYEHKIKKIQSDIQTIDINADVQTIQLAIQSIVSQINEILRNIDGVVKDGD
ncbi:MULTISPECIES: hypothetical protein [unclassified Acinetobacter]|jgi:hypothetical protein|uniref:hypothetical protein n=1 Tax=unclassified Acinetobacter TaxID=196816 RepID=UPI001407BB9E|nr:MULTISPECIES: hypothetical protein [unclassified Acinetobacter]QQN39276.1 hypothetical protein JFY49_15275 [Acinetobacter sp. CS-2]